ncbi:MAG: hypothetical protein Q8J60_00735, partial [Thiobacillus sp.]|nr:hypothetical protein [Thiobacillus sp.]
MDAQQQENRHEDEGGKADEETDFDRTHDADFTRDPYKKARREAGLFVTQPRHKAGLGLRCCTRCFFAIMLLQVALADADRLRRDFDQFVVID